jgi:type VI secretion system protein ImpL
MTFPIDARDGGAVSLFDAAFRQLVERLNSRLTERLQGEANGQRRSLIIDFPVQVASLREPIAAFLNEAFAPSRLGRAPFLRGVYLISGTQTGTPFDVLAKALLKDFGIDQRRGEPHGATAGRSFFVGGVFQDVIFREAGLALRHQAVERRRVRWRHAGFAAAVLFALLLGGALVFARLAGQNDAERFAAAVTAYDELSAKLRLSTVSDGDLLAILPVLDQARDLPFGGEKQASSTYGFRLLPGYDQRPKLGQAANVIYHNALNRVLLPRLLWRAEEAVRRNLATIPAGAAIRPNAPASASLQQATRVMLMLGAYAPTLDAAAIKSWASADWEVSLPTQALAEQRQRLLIHLSALLNEFPGSVGIPLDGALIREAQSQLGALDPAHRAIAILAASRAAQALPSWSPADALGSSGLRFFGRISGKPLSAGIEGLMTVRGFHQVVLPGLADAARQVAAESWLTNRPLQVDPTSADFRRLEVDILKAYTDDYTQVWQELLSDLDMVPPRSVAAAAGDLLILAAPKSPLRDLLGGLVTQLTLSRPPGATSPTTPQTDSLTELLGEAPGLAVDQRFAALRDFTTGPMQDEIGRQLTTMQQSLSRFANTASQGADALKQGYGDAGQTLQAYARSLPAPVANWMKVLAGASAGLTDAAVKAGAGAAYAAPGGPGVLCAAATRLFPFQYPAADMRLNDFEQLMSQDGLLDKFAKDRLQDFIDTASPTWKVQRTTSSAPPLSQADVERFQRIATIRDAFFPRGGLRSDAPFQLTPISVSGAAGVTLNLDGVSVLLGNATPQRVNLSWPGPAGMRLVELTFDSAPPLRETGDWALFRMLRHGVLSGAPNQLRWTVSVGGSEAAFEFRTREQSLPFAPQLLAGFRCPTL